MRYWPTRIRKPSRPCNSLTARGLPGIWGRGYILRSRRRRRMFSKVFLSPFRILSRSFAACFVSCTLYFFMKHLSYRRTSTSDICTSVMINITEIIAHIFQSVHLLHNGSCVYYTVMTRQKELSSRASFKDIHF